MLFLLLNNEPITHTTHTPRVVWLHFIGHEAVFALVSVRIAERTDGIGTDLSLRAPLADKWNKKYLCAAIAPLLDELIPGGMIHKDLG